MEVWLISIVTAFFAAYAGAFLALRRYKHERRRQEKFEAYKEIIDALSDLILWANETYNESRLLPSLNLEVSERFSRGYSSARVCLSKYTDTGKLIVSEEVLDQLNELNNLLWQSDFNFEESSSTFDTYEDSIGYHAKQIKEACEEKLEMIIILAKRDLN